MLLPDLWKSCYPLLISEATTVMEMVSLLLGNLQKGMKQYTKCNKSQLFAQVQLQQILGNKEVTT